MLFFTLGSPILVALYAILVGLGGIEGYRKASSLPSLLAGTGFSLILFIAAFGMFAHKSWAEYLAWGAIGSLIIIFISRWVKTGTSLPALLAAAGVLTLVWTLIFRYKP